MKRDQARRGVRIGLALTIAAAGWISTMPAISQSTMADPYNVGDPAGSATARTAAINATIGSQGKPSAAELARRRAHGDQLSACNTRARNTYRAGSSGRKAARAQCQKSFQAQKATWYDARYQRK